MANTGRRRVNSNRTEIHTYVDGSTARQVHVRRSAEQNQTPVSEKRRIRQSASAQGNGRQKRAVQHRPLSREQLARNRANARSMGLGYVLFLTAACLLTMFLCVRYLSMKSTLTAQNDKIEILESQLNSMQADNDAYYNQVQSSVTLEDIKEAALGYGMYYASESQIEYYSVDESSYLRQYQDVPE
ncbi:MAG: hypothetical protein Q4B03_02540 [Lachnospiraceae bacterium]|nr:hypothetical protein [Lachnospiraceae bacterium]